MQSQLFSIILVQLKLLLHDFVICINFFLFFSLNLSLLCSLLLHIKLYLLLFGELLPKLLFFDLILEDSPIPELLMRILCTDIATSSLSIVNYLTVDLHDICLIRCCCVGIRQDRCEAMLQSLKKLEVMRVLLGVIMHAIDY
jgi:hypothetical protein